MKIIPGKIILTGFISVLAAIACNARSNDSIIGPADYSLLPLQYIWLQTTNPVAYADIEGDRMDAVLGYRYGSGDYKPVSDPRSVHSGKVLVEGFKQVDKLHFYGSFLYNISSLEGQKWKDVLLPSPGNPFILGDSIGGDYDNELFEIKGVMASSANENFKWGVSMNYKGGSSADQNDPRPLIDAMRYSVRPGILYRIPSSSWGLGLDLGYERYREDIKISVIETNIVHHFFLFQGLGLYYMESGISYSRRYKGNAFSGNGHVNWKNNAAENILRIGYENRTENSEDGSSESPFRSGDYKETVYSLSDIFSVKKDAMAHILKIYADYSPSKGIWYDQKKTVNPNDQSIIWEVYNKSVKYKNKVTKAGLEYTGLKERQGFKDYSFGASFDYEQSKTDFLPDMYLQKYSNLKASIKGGKTFWLPGRSQLSLDLDVSYRKNLTSKAGFDGIKLADLWSYPVFEYLTSDFYSGGARAKFSKRTSIGKLPSIIYLTAGIDYIKSTQQTNYFNKPDRINIATSLGFTF